IHGPSQLEEKRALALLSVCHHHPVVPGQIARRAEETVIRDQHLAHRFGGQPIHEDLACVPTCSAQLNTADYHAPAYGKVAETTVAGVGEDHRVAALTHIEVSNARGQQGEAPILSHSVGTWGKGQCGVHNLAAFFKYG